MPTGPKGQKRPADVIGNAVRVMRIATGEESDEVQDDGKSAAAMAGASPQSTHPPSLPSHPPSSIADGR